MILWRPDAPGFDFSNRSVMGLYGTTFPNLGKIIVYLGYLLCRLKISKRLVECIPIEILVLSVHADCEVDRLDYCWDSL